MYSGIHSRGEILEGELKMRFMEYLIFGYFFSLYMEYLDLYVKYY